MGVDGTAQINFTNGTISPETDDDIDLGASLKEFKDLYVDGVAYIDGYDFGGTTIALPSGAGSSGQVLSTNGSNALSWSTVSASVVTVTDNESTNENNALVFTPDGDVDGGSLALESDGNATYNPSTGYITATGFIGNVKVPDAGNVGSASDPDAIAIAANGKTTFSQDAIFSEDIIIGDAKNIGSSSDPDAVAISSGGVVTLSATTASTSASSGALVVGGGAGVAADLYVGDDLALLSDAAVLNLGANKDVTITHDPDDGVELKSKATADDNPFLLTLQTGETDIAASDVLGTINFQAPDESSSTDAILVAAGIEAVSEGTFAADNNATKLSFKTGASEAATEKMALSSGGNLTVSGDLTISGDDLYMNTNTSGYMLIADGTNFNPTAVSGDISISNAGVTAVSSDVIVNADIKSDAAIADSKLATITTADKAVSYTHLTLPTNREV